MVPSRQSRFLLLPLPMLLLTGVLLESGCRRPAADVAPLGNPPAAATARTVASDSTVKALAEFNRGAARSNNTSTQGPRKSSNRSWPRFRPGRRLVSTWDWPS